MMIISLRTDDVMASDNLRDVADVFDRVGGVQPRAYAELMRTAAWSIDRHMLDRGDWTEPGQGYLYHCWPMAGYAG